MTIYQWTVFDCENYSFTYFTGKNLYDVNTRAYDYFYELINNARENGNLDEAGLPYFNFGEQNPAINIVNFCKGNRWYITFKCRSSIEFDFQTFTI